MNYSIKSKFRSLFVALFFISIFGINHQVYTQRTVENRLPENERKLRDELEQDKSILKITCYEDAKETSEANKVKFLLYNASRLRNSTIKAKKICSTTEGDPIVTYLTVENDNVSLIFDNSRDKFGSERVHVYKCKELEIGVFTYTSDSQKRGFRSLTDEELKKQKNADSLVLKIKYKSVYKQTEPEEEYFFY